MNRRGPTLLAVIAGALCVGLIAISPLALDAFRHVSMATVYRRSLVGQTYSAVAAVISGLALIVVGLSLRSQREEALATRVHNSRVLHVNLLQMALEDSDLLDAWGSFGSGDNVARRQHLYVNLILSYWQMAYGLGDLSEKELRVVSRGLFAGQAGQRFWSDARTIRLRTERNDADRRFHRILDEEARKAAQQNGP